MDFVISVLALVSLFGLYAVWVKFTVGCLSVFGIYSKPSYAEFVLGPVIDAVHLMLLCKEAVKPIPSFIWIHWALVVVIGVTIPYVWALKVELMGH